MAMICRECGREIKCCSQECMREYHQLRYGPGTWIRIDRFPDRDAYRMIALVGTRTVQLVGLNGFSWRDEPVRLESGLRYSNETIDNLVLSGYSWHLSSLEEAVKDHEENECRWNKEACCK